MPNQPIIVEAKQPWSGLVKKGQVLVIRDTHGQQAVDFLCYDADNTSDRYSATNTVKVQGNVYVGKGTVYRSLANIDITLNLYGIGCRITI